MAGTILTIGTGETETVAAGETQDSATVRNAGTLENAGTQTAGAFEFRAFAADIDAATATLTQVRALSGTSADIDAATATLTQVRALSGTSADIDAATAVLSAGRFIAGTAADIDAATAAATRSRSLDATAADIDAASSALRRLRELVGAAADIDSASGKVERLRALVGAATDVDAGTGELTLLRELDGTAADIDSATGQIFLLINPESTQPVETIREILNEIPQFWHGEDPTVKNYWDDAQSERGPGADMPPIMYVWQPTGNTKERFSMDGTHTDDTVSVEVLVYSLDDTEPIRYANDAENILEFYFDDNSTRTDFTTVEPITQNDYRQQNPARQTDMFVVGLEIELRRLDDAAVLPS